MQEGERIRAGEPLMDGPLNPHDILAVLGEKELQAYLVNEIQEVYRLQGVNISDKHIEVIVRQMMRWVKVEDVGDTSFLLEQQIDKFRFREENEKAIANGGKPATGRPLLLGITKASLSTDSFISAASFQETTRVLTEASIQGAVDHLRGLKENVIVGRLDSRGHRHGVLPQCPAVAGDGAGRIEGAGGSYGRVRRSRARAGTAPPRRRERSRRTGGGVTWLHYRSPLLGERLQRNGKRGDYGRPFPEVCKLRSRLPFSILLYVAIPATSSYRAVARLSARRFRRREGGCFFRHSHALSRRAGGGFQPVHVAHDASLSARGLVMPLGRILPEGTDQAVVQYFTGQQGGECPVPYHAPP